MIVDTSALIAILDNEPERAAFLDKIKQADRCFISALSLYDAELIALSRLGEQGIDQLTDERGDLCAGLDP
jgi:ribonuclease VapC